MEKHIDTNTPAADHVMTILDSAKITWTVLQACELQLFDALSSGPATSGDLAARNEWEADALRRLMDMMAALKLVKKSKNSNGEDVYENTEAGRLLIKNGPPAFHEYTMMAVTEAPKTIGSLAERIKKGPKSCQAEPEEDKGDGGAETGDHFHSEGDEHPEMWLDLYRMLEGVGVPYADTVVKAFDLSKHKTAVDLGGGSGVFSYALLRAYPDMKVILAELADALPVIEEHFVKKNKNPRLTTTAVDFKKDESLPKADLYILGNIVHESDPPQLKELLTKINNALSPGGGLLIIDLLLNDACDPPSVHSWDLYSHGEGRLYSGKELIQFLTDCNYGNARIIRTQDACPSDMLYATKDSISNI